MSLAAVLSRAEPWQQAWINSKDDPLLFVTGVLGVTELEPWQRKALGLIGKHDRLSIRSGHGVGKSGATSAAMWWMLECFDFPKVPCTAPSASQLRDD